VCCSENRARSCHKSNLP